MDRVIPLSRARLTTFLTCQRQFQLRFINRIAWPAYPLPERVATAVSNGHQFHQLIERHLLDLPIATRDPILRRWWNRFQTHPPPLPPGKRLIETTLTLPISTTQPSNRSYLLNGRFDLLIIGQEENGTPLAHIFDWKTGQPQTAVELQRDWQTRLYLAMVTKGGSALLPKGSPPLHADNIRFTYWYVEAADAPQTIQYSQKRHAENWADLQSIVQQLDSLADEAIWPLTDDLTVCRRCPYQIICQRQQAGTAVPLVDIEDETFVEGDALEPERP